MVITQCSTSVVSTDQKKDSANFRSVAFGVLSDYLVSFKSKGNKIIYTINYKHATLLKFALSFLGTQSETVNHFKTFRSRGIIAKKVLFQQCQWNIVQRMILLLLSWNPGPQKYKTKPLYTDPVRRLNPI